jgi:polysaccharide chain length determinant protein (PEP-CTERM system associated)
MPLTPEQLIPLLLKEAFKFRKPLVLAFCAIALVTLVVAIKWPSRYSASTTILVEERNIIQPLMQGAAVPTETGDRGRMAREVIFGRKMMTKLLKETGRWEESRTPAEQEQIIHALIGKTAITNEGRNLIRIEYRDADPERAFITASKYAELFIDEAMHAKASESQAAFDFIEKQAQEYHEKLAQAEERLKEFRSANLDARPGSEADISARLSALHTRIEQATQELKETEIRKQSLEKQLSGEVETTAAMTRESQYRARLAELHAQLETLRLSYHDTYPDVVRVRHQIADLNEAIVVDQQRREAARASGRAVVDDSVINNPMYQQLKRELSQTQVTMDTLQARIVESRRQLNAELDRGKRVHGGEATLAELTRDYQVNREIYQDLLRRRENARVSMNLDREKQGLTFKVQEPAAMPTQPTGMRFGHIMVGGFLMGFAIPLGLLFVGLQLDPRLRTATQLSDQHKLPLLGVVPHLYTPGATLAVKREVLHLTLVLSGTVAVLMLFGLMRLFSVV